MAIPRPSIIIIIIIILSELIFQICPPDIWNVYKSPMTPVPWTLFITQCRQTRNHTQYLQTRTENSARIHRNRDWTEFNMQLTSELWKNEDTTTLDKQRSLKIIYDLYWHGGNRSKDQRLDVMQNRRKWPYVHCVTHQNRRNILYSNVPIPS
jgi:hypothetical protein